ncbi:MAG TPA: hypothetical protein VLO13_07180, partial [Halomonas sp.]|nr:hypothetical protein [Halomonas sp.]
KCQCGLLTPTIDGVEGRVEDIVLAKDGRKFGMFTYRTLKEIDGLAEAQVRQVDYDDFRVLGVVKQGAEPELVAKHIKSKFEQVLGYPIKFNFEKLESLPRGKNGKVRLVVNEINQS